ncbi:MAG: PaaI family thioesterase, partial [Ruminiclostridium sp.]|nr:PaaI family thioesterase [Ruminiclostridium sp.]
LIAEGHVVRVGRSICLSEATVKNQEGKLLAHGTSKLMVLEGRQSIHTLLAAEGADPLPPKFL